MSIYKLLQFVPAIIIVLFILATIQKCTAPEPKWTPLQANKLEVIPPTVIIGEKVIIRDGVCSTYNKPLDVSVSMTVQTIPPQTGETLTLFDTKVTLKPNECTKSNLESIAQLPTETFQSGFYRLTLTYRATSTTDKGQMKNQIIVLTSNDFQVITK